MGIEIKFPDADRWYVRALRFANMLDDAHNMLSPVKLNVWAANVTTVCTAIGSIFGHISNDVWAPLMAWVTQAHATHHYDKKERNRATVAAGTEDPAHPDGQH